MSCAFCSHEKNLNAVKDRNGEVVMLCDFCHRTHAGNIFLYPTSYHEGSREVALLLAETFHEIEKLVKGGHK